MHVLFVHSNFPAQFRYLAPRLARHYGWRCSFVTRNATAPAVSGIERIVYSRRGGAGPGNHPCTRYFEDAVRDAHGVYEAMKKRPDVKPDLVVAHSGFGSSLFLPHLYDAPVINFFEYFFQSSGGAFDFRPEIPVVEADVLRAKPNNSMILLDLDNCDRGWCPNYSQRDTLPKEYHHKIEVIPEGVDTCLYSRKSEIRSTKYETNSKDRNGNDPNGRARRVLPDGTVIPDGTRVVTYVARGFELMRGFDVFMAAAKRIYEMFPEVVFVVVGTDQAHYLSDRKYTGGKTLRRRILETGNFDLSRFRFTGFLPEDKLIDVLSMSDLHIYLTAPFITSWSMVDAMSCSCVVLASEQGCTREYISDGTNGLLCDFFDAEALARRAVEVLRDPVAYRPLGEAARKTIEEKYSLDVCAPKIARMFEEVVAKGPRTPSARAEGLVRAGSPAAWKPRAQKWVGKDVGVELPPFDGAIPFYVGRREVDDVEMHDVEMHHARAGRPCHGDAVPFSPSPGTPGEGRGEGSDSTLRSENSDPETQRPSPLPSPGVPGEGESSSGKTVLFAWELGAGLGHLMQMLPLAEDLARAGHCVVVALRHLERAAAVFGKAGVFYFQAPYRSPHAAPARRPAGFAQLLSNLGFGDDDELFALASAWRNLIRSVKPDLIVCDYSPTALLAARAFPEVRRAVIGSGFCVPPDVVGEVWGPIRPGVIAADATPARVVEAEVLSRVNWLLENWGEAPLDRLGQLYGDADETFLTTFPELDHFRQRPRAAYWGLAVAPASGEAPKWPDAPGQRVFAYLKATAVAGEVLRALKDLKLPTVAYVDGLSAAARKRLASPTLHVAEGRVDVARAGRECDLAVLNGGHGVTAEMLLAGKPVLVVPLVLEQHHTGAALRRLGAGDVAPTTGGEPWDWTGRGKLEAVASDDGYADAARAFAGRYAAFDPVNQREAMVRRVAALMTPPKPCDTTERETAAVG